MQVHLQGGFGEKGRTSVCVQTQGCSVMLDAGIKVGAGDDSYHPRLALSARDLDALVISHAHEDHVGALCWLAAQGYTGPIYMTAETLAETPAALAQYARPDDLAAHPLASMDIRTVQIGTRFSVGPLAIDTGHSGHVAGGMWIAASDTSAKVVYCGDVVPNSEVFPMTALPQCDLLVIDASYGADPVSAHDRAIAIRAWIATHSGGCVLPTPLAGRSLELIAIQEGPFAISGDMADPLLAQIRAISGHNPKITKRLVAKVERAHLWNRGDQFPTLPLLVHDGMGVAGPAATAIPLAVTRQTPMLFTGHLPDGSPGAIAFANGQADWIRLPTHPTLHENNQMCGTVDAARVFGHSCATADLTDLADHIDALDPTAKTGQTHFVNGRDR
ncbi:MBL fold metallo-hydrolase [Roseobacter litoralis]|uniref:Metallo-beta-lactamase-like protein n=1 Tax=Roseobacter litoralis (strain ATCC 49566 / DSM 6996 / JCM 21268 / NBRC 15278 / OCh 149) TaxID=391595 RepID=F7ZKJ5_ROSLO|nr:MBL fold metallo-hydrolase [Roseobacter litoralis]AEI95209.1 metallo-beta-lactamase-like protein [Roseobacter litoralis Och 149]